MSRLIHFPISSAEQPAPAVWDRGRVLAALDSWRAYYLSVGDPLPDMLIAKAQELGITPEALEYYIREWAPWDVDPESAGLHTYRESPERLEAFVAEQRAMEQQKEFSE